MVLFLHINIYIVGTEKYLMDVLQKITIRKIKKKNKKKKQNKKQPSEKYSPQKRWQILQLNCQNDGKSRNRIAEKMANPAIESPLLNLVYISIGYIIEILKQSEIKRDKDYMKCAKIVNENNNS